MAVDFITGNPTGDAFDKAQDRATKQAKIDQEIAVDTAVRQGVGDMLTDRQAQSQYQLPAVMPQGYQPSKIRQPDAGIDKNTAALESGGNPTTVNKLGFSGKYQFGKPALIDAGIYRPADAEDIRNQSSWGGQFTVPGRAQPLNYQQWLNDPEAQDASWEAHKGRLRGEIQRRGLGQYVGQTIGGVPITEDTLIGMMHGGGARGTEQFLRTGGQYNPADANGTSIADFGRKIGGGAPVQAPPMPATFSPGDVAPSVTAGVGPPGVSFMPGAGVGSRYDSVLNRLAAVPGGGTAALKLMEAQGRFDQQNYKRNDTYQRLAMMALAHGDTNTARYYAAAGGMQLPENVMSNQGNATLLGRGSLLAHRIYGADPQQAQRFLQVYLQNGGDVSSAFTAAGAPASNPGYKLQWAQQEDGTLRAMVFNPKTGVLQPAAGLNGEDVTQAPKPVQQRIQWVRQPDGSEHAYQMDQRTRQLVPVIDQDGNPMKQAPKQTAGALTLDHKVNMLVGTGMPYAEAVAAATGTGIRPGTVANAYKGFYSAFSNSIAGMQADEPTRQAAVEQQMVSVFGPNWRRMMMGATPAPGGNAPGYQAPGTAPPQPQQNGPTAAPQMSQAEIDQSVANARRAIAQGKSRAMVIERLKQLGVPVPPDL